MALLRNTMHSCTGERLQYSHLSINIALTTHSVYPVKRKLSVSVGWREPGRKHTKTCVQVETVLKGETACEDSTGGCLKTAAGKPAVRAGTCLICILENLVSSDYCSRPLRPHTRSGQPCLERWSLTDLLCASNRQILCEQTLLFFTST